MQDQDTRSRGVVQPRPGQLDFLQLAQGLAAEEFNRFLVAGFRRVRAELAVDLPPSELLRSAEREGAVGEPQVGPAGVFEQNGAFRVAGKMV